MSCDLLIIIFFSLAILRFSFLVFQIVRIYADINILQIFCCFLYLLMDFLALHGLSYFAYL